MNRQLLRRAWDALDSFKQAYPENWNEDDEQVMVDLMRADLKMSGVKPKWVGLTEQDIKDCEKQAMVNGSLPFEQRSFFARAIEAKLKERNE